MKRAKHTLSHYRMVTADMGELFPIGCTPVLPGDTMQHHISALVRLSPLNTPVMHPTTVRIHHWFVPNRLVWPESENGGWEQFITGGPDGLNAQQVPQFVTDTTKKTLTTYLGAPPIAASINALPLRATNFIYNRRYRDQDLVATERALNDNTVPKIAWEKDYFTTARPWSQKGPQVTLPVGSQAPLTYDHTVADNTDLTVQGTDGSIHAQNASGTGNVRSQSATGSGTPLYADLSSASAIDVNDFRAAFSLQRYQEARARYGSRFTEYLRYLGIQPSDARLQDPEYLGGGTSRLQYSEVLQTAGTTDGSGDGVGDLYGHGIAGLRSNRYRKFFEEHGYVISLMSIRPKAIYMNGMDREWTKRDKEDFFQRELANLGQQEVFKRELYGGSGYEVFGYQDRYEEYRRGFSQVSQDFRDTLNSWHMARETTSGVTLNQSFVECDPAKRIFQVETDDVLWIMANHHLVARRMVPKRANPRII